MSVNFHYIKKPQVFMLEAPQANSTIVSDAIYSEKMAFLEERGKWVRIQISSN